MGYDARVKKLTSYTYSPTIPTSEDSIREQLDDAIQETFDNITEVLLATTADDAGADSVGTEGTFGASTVADEIKAIKVITDGITSDEFTHRNYLINGGFSVWQRGTASVTANNEYTADRWKLVRQATLDGKVDQVSALNSQFDHAIRIEATADKVGQTEYTEIKQSVEDYSVFKGETIAVSVSANVDSGVDFRIAIADGVLTTGETSEGTGALQTYTATKSVSASASELTISLRLVRNDILNGEGVTIQYAKCEISSYITDFVIKPYAEELIDCQRYFQLYSTNSVDDYDLRPSMRITPTVTGASSPYEYDAEI